MASHPHSRPNAKERFHDKMTETRDDVLDLGTLAKKAVTESIRDVKDGAAELYDKSQEKVGAWGKAMRRQFEEAPVKSLLVAAGIGLILGFVMRRRRS